MSKLCISLPPFAPDYSGAASAIFDMGGLVVLHDASGCTGNYLGYDEPRWFGSKNMVYCSGLRHMDAVLGNDEKLINKIALAAESLNPKFIAVLGSPVPMVIGTDFKGMAQEIEHSLGIPAIGIETTGLRYYNKGIHDVTKELLKKFAREKKPTIAGTINIIGMTPLDFHINGNDTDFIKLFETNGIPVLSCYYMGLTIEDLQQSVSADLNVVVAQNGIEVARYMEKYYGIPYIAITPMGDGTSALQYVQAALKEEPLPQYVPNSGQARTAIVGDQIICNAIRQYLQTECNYGAIDVLSMFDMEKEYMSNDDALVKTEKELRQRLNSGKYTTVIADPLMQQLIRQEGIRFYAFPHVAVSSKVHWDDCKSLMSGEMTDWLKNIK